MATTFVFRRWRPGAYNVSGVRHPSGACGCVYRSASGEWRILYCDGWDSPPTFQSRQAAAQGEADLIAEGKGQQPL